MYYVEGKTLDGANSLDHLLEKGAKQADWVVVNIVGTNDVNYISREVKSVFEQNENLREILLLKGSRLIPILKEDIKSKDYKTKFRKIWIKQK